jgi:hypothetical protein
MLICLINTPSMPTPGTHFYTTNKFIHGFRLLGYEQKLITNEEQLKSIPDSENTIFVVSNHGFAEGNSSKLEVFSRFTKSTFILWFFHDLVKKNNFQLPIKNWILTGEHFHEMPRLQPHISFWNLQKQMENYHPLTFLSYLNPTQVGSFIRGPIIWDAQFVGSPYKTDWLQKLPNCFARTTALNTSEEDRIKSFLQSHCALGFHSDPNIANNVVVERVPEALSFGAICLSDNPASVNFTDGIVEFVSSFEETKDKILFYKTNEEAANKKRIAGYDWVKAKGTYRHLAESFLNKMKELGFTK